LSRVRVSAERLGRDLDALAELGQDPAGGMTRLALSPADAQARAYVFGRMRELGMTTSHDEVGNLVGRWGPATGPSVMSGSHLDSVPRGGRYDGPLGVVGAVEAVRVLAEAGFAPKKPIDIVVFTGEEGSRFGRGTIGSAAWAGDVPIAEILALRDAGGIAFEDALATYADEGPAVPAKRPAGAVAAFVELHIEQGGVLESRRLDIGAVTAVAGLVQFVVRLAGDANHAGATPMNLRKDALAGAAEVVLGVEKAARELGGGAVATVGKLEVDPGAFNIIPGAAVLGIDARATDPALLDGLERAVRDLAARAAKERGLQAEVTRRQRVAPGPLDERVIGAVERAAAAAGLRSLRMPSGAIHDALHMANHCPSGMIFIPSSGGKSHCPEELSSLDDMARGVEVLALTLAELSA
jgi:hydantoinase/carbamoylase family amidase